MTRQVEIVTIDLDDMDLDPETRALLERACPDEPVDLEKILTDEKIAEIMVEADLVTVH